MTEMNRNSFEFEISYKYNLIQMVLKFMLLAAHLYLCVLSDKKEGLFNFLKVLIGMKS